MFTDNEDPLRRVAIYIRVSTEEQKRDGYGLDAQEKRLKEYITNNPGLRLTTQPEWLYSDTHTGSDLNRPALNRLREDVKKKKFDAVVVWKIDRFSRSLKHLINLFEELEESNVSFISMQENIDFRGPMGRLIYQIFGAIAQFERELIQQRTTMGRIASAEAGNFTGTKIPYGYSPYREKGARKGKKIAIEESEASWVRKMYNWYIYEGYGDNKIADLLNKEHAERPEWRKVDEVWTKIIGKGKWTHKMVNNILTNDLYRGQFVAIVKDEEGNELPPDKYTIVEVPNIVSELVFTQAQMARHERASGRAAATAYMLSGKLRDCSLKASRGFVGAPRYKGGSSYRRKQFVDKETGEKHAVFEVPTKGLDDFVWGKIMQALDEPEVFIKHYLSKQFLNPSQLAVTQEQLGNVRSQLANLELRAKKIEYAYESGAYDEEKLSDKLGDIGRTRVQLEQKEQELQDELNVLSVTDTEVQSLKEASEVVRHRLDKLDTRQKKILCGLFVDRVEMYRERATSDDGRQKWKVTANVVFRFNPSKLKALGKGVEPEVIGSKLKNRTQVRPMDEDGGSEACDPKELMISRKLPRVFIACEETVVRFEDVLPKPLRRNKRPPAFSAHAEFLQFGNIEFVITIQRPAQNHLRLLPPGIRHLRKRADHLPARFRIFLSITLYKSTVSKIVEGIHNYVRSATGEGQGVFEHEEKGWSIEKDGGMGKGQVASTFAKASTDRQLGRRTLCVRRF